MNTKDKVFVGMDVHKDTVVIALLPDDAREPTVVKQLSHDPRGLRRLLDRLARESEARRENPGIGDAPLLPAPKTREVHEPFAGARLVGECARTCWAGAEAWQRLALPEAEVRLGPHDPAAQGAAQARRLENRANSAPVLPESRRRESQAEAPGGGGLLSQVSAHQLASTGTLGPVS